MHLDDGVRLGFLGVHVDVHLGHHGRVYSRVGPASFVHEQREVELAGERAFNRLRDARAVVVGDAAEWIGTAKYVERTTIGRAEQARLQDVEPADRERAGQSHQQTGTVVGNDGNGNVTAVDALATNSRCVAQQRFVHAHGVDVEREDVLLG